MATIEVVIKPVGCLLDINYRSNGSFFVNDETSSRRSL